MLMQAAVKKPGEDKEDEGGFWNQGVFRPTTKNNPNSHEALRRLARSETEAGSLATVVKAA